MDYPEPYCIGCQKPAHLIEEYAITAKMEDTTVAEYIREEEGTYNRQNGHILCTNCYIRWGQPSSPNGWVAP